MKKEVLDALLEFTKIAKDTPTYEGVKLVLVDGLKVSDAAGKVGMAQPNLSRAIAGIRNAQSKADNYLQALRESHQQELDALTVTT